LSDGKLAAEEPSLPDIKEKVQKELESLDMRYKRLLNPHIYKVSISEQLRALKLDLIKNHLGDL